MTQRRISWLLWLIVAWLVFVVSLTFWWMIFSLRTIRELNQYAQNIIHARQENMLIMEGSVLILFLIFGGGGLIYFALREKKRFEEVRHFFSSFSHDLKTSLSRVVLQSEKLGGNQSVSGDIKELQRNLISLERQLENSLHLAQREPRSLTLQTVDLKSVISRLHTQWPDMKFSLSGQGRFLGDAVALESIFKNLVSNSHLHGGADEITIQVKVENDGLQVRYFDNGNAGDLNLESLGQRLQPSQKGSGVGLYIVQQWVTRLRGRLMFSKNPESGLVITLWFPTEVTK